MDHAAIHPSAFPFSSPCDDLVPPPTIYRNIDFMNQGAKGTAFLPSPLSPPITHNPFSASYDPSPHALQTAWRSTQSNYFPTTTEIQPAGVAPQPSSPLTPEASSNNSPEYNQGSVEGPSQQNANMYPVTEHGHDGSVEHTSPTHPPSPSSPAHPPIDVERRRSIERKGEGQTPAQAKRKAQNRAAQRAFRERKEQHTRNLQTSLEKCMEECETLEKNLAASKDKVEQLTADKEKLQKDLTDTREELSNAKQVIQFLRASLMDRTNQPTTTGSNPEEIAMGRIEMMEPEASTGICNEPPGIIDGTANGVAVTEAPAAQAPNELQYTHTYGDYYAVHPVPPATTTVPVSASFSNPFFPTSHASSAASAVPTPTASAADGAAYGCRSDTVAMGYLPPHAGPVGSNTATADPLIWRSQMQCHF